MRSAQDNDTFHFFKKKLKHVMIIGHFKWLYINSAFIWRKYALIELVIRGGQRGYFSPKNATMLIGWVVSNAILLVEHESDALFGLYLCFRLVQCIFPKLLQQNVPPPPLQSVPMVAYKMAKYIFSKSSSPTLKNYREVGHFSQNN